MNAQTFNRTLPIVLSIAVLTAACSGKESPPTSEPAAPAPATAPTAPAPESVVNSASAGDAGASAYGMYCVTCHGAAGKGDGVASAALNPRPADFSAGAFKYDVNGNGTKGDADDIKAIIRDGAAKHGGSPLMAPWPMLSADQLQAVAEYVKSLHAG